MGAITLDGILRAEHEVLRAAFGEWVAMDDKTSEDLYWVMGVHDMANKLIDTLEGKDGDGDN